MPKKSLLCVCAAAAALCVAVPAEASIVGAGTRATIPFEFVVSGKTMPAGDYSFDIKAGQPVVAMRNEKGASALVFIGRQVGSYQHAPKPHFVFEKRDGKYVLKEVWSATGPAK